MRTAALVECAVLVFDQLDSQPLGRNRDLNLLGELLQFLPALISASSFSFSFCRLSFVAAVTVSPVPVIVVPSWLPVPWDR